MTEKLAAAAVHVSDVDGESLFSEAITKIERNQSAGDIIKNAVKGFPANVMDIRCVDKPEYDERTKKWMIKVEVSVDREKYRTFTKNLIPILQQIATDSKRVTISAFPMNERLSLNNTYTAMEGFNYRVCTQVNDARTSTIWEIFAVPEEAIKAADSVIKKLTFTVDIVDGRDDIVASGTYDMPAPCHFDSRFGVALCAPLLMKLWYIGNDDLSPGTDKATYILSFDISPNEFKRMKNIVCRING